MGLKQALIQENPLQIVGTINAYTALLAKQAGFKAIYLSGAGVSNAILGLPDLGLINLNDMLREVDRITNACELPLLVDVDTGFGETLSIARTVKTMIKAGAAGVHLEDQVATKRCGHRSGKHIVSIESMCDRIQAAQEANTQTHFTIMARTDALATEGLELTINRMQQYVKAGAEMIFFEGAETLEQYQAVTHALSVPVLANITEFGLTPLFTKEALRTVGIQLILYPQSAFRIMSEATLQLFQTIRAHGTQQSCVNHMQTRQALYQLLQYDQYEKIQDKLHERH